MKKCISPKNCYCYWICKSHTFLWLSTHPVFKVLMLSLHRSSFFITLMKPHPSCPTAQDTGTPLCCFQSGTCYSLSPIRLAKMSSKQRWQEPPCAMHCCLHPCVMVPYTQWMGSGQKTFTLFSSVIARNGLCLLSNRNTWFHHIAPQNWRVYPLDIICVYLPN